MTSGPVPTPSEDAHYTALELRRWLLDLRCAVRALVRHPYFTAIAIAMIGVGIGTSAGVFTLVDALLLRPLDVHEPDSVVRLTNTRPGVPRYVPFSYAMWEALIDRQSSLEGLFAWAYLALTVEIADSRERVGGFVAAANAFELLGVDAALGRRLSWGDRGQPVAVLSHDYWRRRFTADPAGVGRRRSTSRRPRRAPPREARPHRAVFRPSCSQHSTPRYWSAGPSTPATVSVLKRSQ